MKKSKFSLILALVIIFALVTPFVTYATDVTEQELTSTSGSTDQAVATSETEGSEPSDSTTEPTDEPTTDDETSGETEATEDENLEEEELEEVKGNYFERGSDLVFNKAVDGNAFLTGDTVTIKGKVNGDLFVFASDVTLEKEAQVYGNLFLIADNFTHIGLVYNLFAFTTNYTCDYDGLTALDLKVFANNIKFSGYVERTAYFSANNIELTDDAYIIGNFVYSSSNEPTIGEKATIYGDKLADDTLTMFLGLDTSNQVINYVTSIITLLGSVLLILLLINFFKPNTLSTDLKFNFIKCLKALGIGLLSFIILILAVILLLLSVVFAEFSAILLIGFILALMLSSTVVILSTAVMLYNKLNKNKSKLFVFLYAILVALVYYALTLIPVAGFIISILIALTGLGFIILWLFNIRKTNKALVNNVDSEDNSENDVIKTKKVSNKEAKKEKNSKSDETKKQDDNKKDNK